MPAKYSNFSAVAGSRQRLLLISPNNLSPSYLLQGLSSREAVKLFGQLCLAWVDLELETQDHTSLSDLVAQHRDPLALGIQKPN